MTVGDEPAAWAALGFAVEPAGVCTVGSTHCGWPARPAAGGSGRGRWHPTWRRAATSTAWPTVAGSAGGAAPGPTRGAAVDHVVVVTPDLDRTTAALDDRGIVARRTRDAGRGRAQRFFRLGEVILELVGPAAPGDGPATFWGLAFTVADLDAATARLGGRIGIPGTPSNRVGASPPCGRTAPSRCPWLHVRGPGARRWHAPARH